jgi:hypothetical protein
MITDRKFGHKDLDQTIALTNCESPGILDIIGKVGSPIPPGAEMHYPYSASANSTGLTEMTYVQIWLYLCITYTDMVVNPPKRHYTCMVQNFRDENGNGEVLATDVLKGHFEFALGGCAN